MKGSNTVFKFYSELPSWAKGVVAITGIVVAGIAGYSIYKSVKNAQGKKDSKDVAKDVKAELNVLTQQGMKPSFPDSVYSNAVSIIVKKLDGCDGFSPELEVVREVAKVVKNKFDWAYLVYKFGVKTIPNCGWGDTSYTLPALLKDQLDSSGIYTGMDIGGGVSSSGVTSNSFNLLETYLKSKGVSQI
jgi:hypothetical protein